MTILGQMIWDMGLEQGIEKGMEKGMEQGMEKGMEKGMEQGMEQGIEQGMEKGREKGIQALILDNLEEGISKERIIKKLSLRFSLEESEARTFYERYGTAGLPAKDMGLENFV